MLHIGSRNVSDDALKRACYVVRFLLADNQGVRESYYKLSGRVAIMASHEVTTSIPEHRSVVFLDHPCWRNWRAVVEWISGFEPSVENFVQFIVNDCSDR